MDNRTRRNQPRIPGVTLISRRKRDAKTFAMSFDLAEIFADKAQGLNYDGRDIVLDELYDLGHSVLVPLYRQYAPEKPGYTKRHLKESIRFRRDKMGLGIMLSMNWYGKLTAEGRGGLPGPAGKVYRFELPNGIIIYRTHTGKSDFGAATQRASSTPTYIYALGRANGEGSAAFDAPPLDRRIALYRMHWMQRAYEAVQKGGYFAQYADNIAARLWAEVFQSRFAGTQITIPAYNALATPQIAAMRSNRIKARKTALHRMNQRDEAHSGRLSAKGGTARAKSVARLQTRIAHRNERAHLYERSHDPRIVPIGRTR